MTPESDPAATPSAAQTPADIRIVSGHPDEEEIAAVTAVVSAALEELAAEQGRRDAPRASRWERARRGLRRPLVRGDWRSPLR